MFRKSLTKEEQHGEQTIVQSTVILDMLLLLTIPVAKNLISSHVKHNFSSQFRMRLPM